MPEFPSADPLPDRRLAAILMADIAGYSRLMGEDEAGTLDRLAEIRGITERLIAHHGGRIANTAGDSVLAEFASVQSAVRASFALQSAVAAANEPLPESRRLLFRTGIHVGEVLVRAGDLFGDAVNITGRLQTLAEPGGIVLSEAAHDAVRKTIDVPFAPLGPQMLKHIEAPVTAFAARPPQGSFPPAAVAETTGDQPSIVVLPFTTASQAAVQDYLCDGIVEDITLALAHVPRLFVVARNSAFTYKGKSVDVRSVGRELGVRYVLSGSIRRAGERLRVAAELTDAGSGHMLWAERFERILGDVFLLQDEISAAVVGAVAPWITSAEIERAHRRPPDRLEAYHLFLQALPAIRAMREPENARGLQLVAKALELDPAYAVAAGLGAWAHTLRAAQAWQADPASERAEGLALGERALLHGADDAEALSWGGYAVGFLGAEIERGLVAVDRALELNPNSAQAYANAGWLRVFAGQFDDAIAMFKAAERVSPKDSERYRPMAGQSFCHLFLGHFDEAIRIGRAAIAANPAYTPTYRALAAALGHQGADEAARHAMTALRRRAPNLTLANAVEQTIFRHCGRLSILVEGLRRAGLRE